MVRLVALRPLIERLRQLSGGGVGYRREAAIAAMAHEVRQLTVQADAHRQALLRQTQCRKLRDLHDRS